MKVVMSDRALAYLQSEQAYLAAFDKRAARAFVHQLKSAAKLIGQYPQAGVVAEPAKGVRRYVSAPYQIDYILGDDLVIIAAIRHGRQNPRDVDDELSDGTEL